MNYPDNEEIRGLMQTINSWIKLNPKKFTIKELDYDLCLKTREDRYNRSYAIKYLVEHNIIETGDNRSTYVPIDKTLEPLNVKNANTSEVDLWLPLGIHELFRCMEGNIIVIAGETNAGKTALVLNILKNNRKHMDVNYFNSEMSAAEYKHRLESFTNTTIDDWKDIKAYYRLENFHHVIKPGRGVLNVIDYLEVVDDFFAVGKMISKIHAKLNGAICVIAIQKKTGSEFGVGGEMTTHKARLVLNVSPGKIQIQKLKIPKAYDNGKEIDTNKRSSPIPTLYFKLINGSKIVMIDWKEHEKIYRREKKYA